MSNKTGPKPPNFTELAIPTINDDLFGIEALIGLMRDAGKNHSKVVLTFNKCKYLSPTAIAVLGGMVLQLDGKGILVELDEKSFHYGTGTTLRENGFLTRFGSGKQRHGSGNTVPFRHFTSNNEEEIMNHLRTAWLKPEWVHLSSGLADAIASTMWEIYANAFEHSESPVGVMSCGEYFPSRNQLRLTVVDFGVGIPKRVRQFLHERSKEKVISTPKCMEWAVQKGNSTKPGTFSRGLGLGILHEFVYVNKGVLEIYSDDGYAQLRGVAHTGVDDFKKSGVRFPGTLVSVTFMCDESYYRLSSEDRNEPIF